MSVTVAEITALRSAYETERNNKGVRLIPYLTVQTHALETYEPITLKFISCGGWSTHLDFRIVGGPDDGKRVTTYPWSDAKNLEYGATVFNGDRAAYDEEMGYPARPSISHVGELHAVTVATVSQYLIQDREQTMATHLQRLWERVTPSE